MTTPHLTKQTWYRRAALSIVTTFLLIVGLAVGPGAPAAEAYTMQYGGHVSWTRITGMHVIQSSLAYQPWRTMVAPVVTLGRAASTVPRDTSQRVDVETYLQKYSGGWTTIASTRNSIQVNYGETNRQVAPGVIGRYPSGYYRVQVVIKWFNYDDTISGVRYYVPSVPADQVCMISTCRSYYGYVATW